MANVYSFNQKDNEAKIGANTIISYLKKQGGKVVDVQDDEEYRKEDVDLLYFTDNSETPIKLEVKVDKYTSGNFFFETFSNFEKKTPGCFLYTTADYIFYYFSTWDRLYILPTNETRNWFNTIKGNYKDKPVKTPYGWGKYYTTIGKVIPIELTLKNVSNIKVIEELSKK